MVLFLAAIKLNDGTGVISSKPSLLLISLAIGSLSFFCLIALFSNKLRKMTLHVSEERQYFPQLLFVVLFGSFLTAAALFAAIYVVS